MTSRCLRQRWIFLALLALLSLALGACTTAEDADTTDSSEAPATSTSATLADGGDGQEFPDEPADPSAGPDVVTQSDELAPAEGLFSACPDCHAYFDPPGDVPATLKENFGHRSHLERRAECRSCHIPPIHSTEGIALPQMVTCFDCHGDTSEAVAPGDCLLCHPEDFPLVPASHSPEFYEQSHPNVAQEEGRDYCALCHEGGADEVCDQCHGLTMPHPGTFLPGGGNLGQHVQQAQADPDVCRRCHELRADTPAACYGPECHGA